MVIVSVPEKCLVVTLAQTLGRQAEKEREKKLNEISEVTLNTVEPEVEVKSIFWFDDDLF